MKTSELIRKNTENLINALKEADAAAKSNTACEYRVYIDSNGECGHEEWLAGDLGWYEFRDPDYRRYYIHTFCYALDLWFVDPEEYDHEAIMEAIGDAESKDVYEEIVKYAIKQICDRLEREELESE